MVKKTAKGWVVLSKDGKKKLGGPYPDKRTALKRIRQIEFHKRKGS